MSAALKVPKNTVAPIILKWKKFWTTKTLPRPGKSEQLGEKGLCHSDRAPKFLYGDGRTSAALHQSGLYGSGPDGSQSSVKDTWQPAWSLPKDT
jgi:hypothetical protein